MDKINVGTFDKIVLFQSSVIIKGLAGQILKEWKNEIEVFASAEQVNKDESEVNYNIISEQVLKITTYQISNLTNRWRVVYEEENYEILSVNNVRNTPYVMIIAQKNIE